MTLDFRNTHSQSRDCQHLDLLQEQQRLMAWKDLSQGFEMCEVDHDSGREACLSCWAWEMHLTWEMHLPCRAREMPLLCRDWKAHLL